MMNVLIAGAGGNLGRLLVSAFKRHGADVKGLSFRTQEMDAVREQLSTVLAADVTKPEDLAGVCEGVDIVVSVIGITRMKGKLTHRGVDYQGNMNLLNAAQQSGVKKFVFISPAGTDQGYKQVPLYEAKYLFEQALVKSGLEWVIFRAGGFFGDLANYGAMAAKGRMWVFGDGKARFTPILEADLAEVMAEDSLKLSNTYVDVGGPQDLSWNEISEICLKAYGKPVNISGFPLWACRLMLVFLKPFFPQYYGMGELIVYTSTHDLVTARRGKTGFEDFLKRKLQQDMRLAV